VYYQEHREKHLGVIVAARKRRRIALNERINAAKASLGCICCSENDPVCLEFHHPDPAEKDFAIGSTKRIGYSWKKILAEIAKCVVVCSNCHKKLHAGRIALPSRESYVDRLIHWQAHEIVVQTT